MSKWVPPKYFWKFWENWPKFGIWLMNYKKFDCLSPNDDGNQGFFWKKMMAITDQQSWSCLFQIKFHVICIQTIWNNTKSNRISLIFHQFSWNSKRRETFKSEIDKSITETVKITTSIEYIELTTCTKKKDIYLIKLLHLYCCYFWPFLQFTYVI